MRKHVSAGVWISASTFVLLVHWAACMHTAKQAGPLAQADRYDLVIKSGKIVDGAGNPWFAGDVGIKGTRIARIGHIPAQAGRKVIDAKGLYVVPGFIDVHTHVDEKIDSEPAVKNYLFQGVTTVVGGNCGFSQYPLGELMDRLEKKGIAINFASLTGHNTLREQVMGTGDDVPTATQLASMKQRVRQEMEAGAIGLSTGLAYVPGRYSTSEEIIALAEVLKPYRGVYATHLRNQGDRIRAAIEEAISIGQKAGIPVQISHIKLSSESVWGQTDLIFDPIEKARQAGIEIYMDQYPYTATSSGFTSSFPGWAVAGGNRALVERLKDPDNHRKIKQALIQNRLTSESGIDKPKTIYVSHNPNHPEYEGKNLAEILEILGREATVDNAAELIIEMEKTDQPQGIFFQMSDEDVGALMKKPYNMIGSDGEIEIPGVEVPHPRAYGTFPRVIAKYVKQLGVLTLTDAVRKMTSLPAQAMGFGDRGRVAPGFFADLVIFDLDTIRDTASYKNPHQSPEGIRWVLVNGKIAARDGRLVTTDAGEVLRNRSRPID